MFCPKCGSLLKTKLQKTKSIQFCSCGYSSDAKEDTTIKETVKADEKEIEVIDEEQVEVYPTVNIECPKCKNKKAYYWLKQTRAGDEPETKFYKCTKCKYTWRDYG